MIAEPKPLPANYEARFRLRPKRGHRERDLDVTGQAGSQFRVILRESNAYTYAEPTDRFASLQEAVGCMIADCGFVLPEPAPEPQLRLFEDEG